MGNDVSSLDSVGRPSPRKGFLPQYDTFPSAARLLFCED